MKKIDLHFPLGLEVTARNLKGVTIKDALDAIHKQFKKKVRNQIRLDWILLILAMSSGRRRVGRAIPQRIRVGS